MEQSSRGTGRTQRMVQEAVSEALKGKDVVIVVYAHQMVDIARRIETLMPSTERPTYETFVLKDRRGSVSLLTPSQANLDWKAMHKHGFYDMWLVDHYVIETEFEAALKMLRRYDLGDGR